MTWGKIALWSTSWRREQLIHAVLGDPDVIAAEVERHTGASADELVNMITERNLSSMSLP